ncbi:MAG: methyltransferase [Methanomethylovorans sp.]|nr:methyltransferase [Methanomethylovorans sp.]
MPFIKYRNACVQYVNDVYEPGDDSFLLADAALDYVNNGMNILEIGTGTGFVSAVIKANFEVNLLATDINPHAVKCAYENGVPTIQADMFSAFKPLNNFDMIIFNPPYLPTTEDDKIPGWLNYAFDGGIDGTDSIRLFLQNVRSHLCYMGTLLLIISSLNDIKIINWLMRDSGLETEIVAKKKCFFEELLVLRGILKN